MLNLNNIYNYYSSQLIIPKSTKVHARKIDDLKEVYKKMVKQNQTSPLYKFTFSDAVQSYAIGIKEAAISLENDSRNLGNSEDTVFEELVAVSDNENIVYANLTDANAEDLPDKLSIKVDKLATGQTNVGTYFSSGESSFPLGNYSFGIAVGANQYTFNLSVKEGDTNGKIQRRLADSINENITNVHASIRNNRLDGTSALVIRSDAVGKPNDNDLFFRFEEAYLENDITTALGIDNIETAPSNAEFYVNDVAHTSISNRISLNHALDIDLLSETEEPVTIHVVPDEDKISDKLNDFIHSYNTLVDLSRTNTSKLGNTKLFQDITGLVNRNAAALSDAGVTIEDSGYLSRSSDDEISTANIRTLFDEETSSFRKDLKRLTGKMTLNPIDYIDKTIVTYPNTSGTYPNPYQPSKYSGLLFNDYA